MFRSYEFSLTMNCSELRCPAQLPKSVLPKYHFTGSLRTVQGGRCHHHSWSNCCGPGTVLGDSDCCLMNPHNKPVE